MINISDYDNTDHVTDAYAENPNDQTDPAPKIPDPAREK